MAELVWHAPGARKYETGVSKGVLYPQDSATGEYPLGVAWNGLTNVTESPSGAEPNKQYADNIQYLTLVSAEEFSGTIEAFYSPPEFDECDGSATPRVGVRVGQQTRKPFGFCYRTEIGNELTADAGYKLHLVYGALAAPSEKAYATVNDSPEATPLSWEFSTTPVSVAGLKPTAILTIDSTQVAASDLAALETLLYGDAVSDPQLPLPDDVIALFAPPPAWTASTAYALNDQVTLSGGQVLEATVAGTSGATQPTAPASVGGTVVDGSVTWTRVS